RPRCDWRREGRAAQRRDCRPPLHEAKQSIAVSVLVAVPVVVMPGSGVILVEFAMQIPQGSVIGAVLPVAVEALLVGAPVSFVDAAMELPVPLMVALMLSVVAVVVVVCECRRGRCRQGQHSRRHECFADRH